MMSEDRANRTLSKNHRTGGDPEIAENAAGPILVNQRADVALAPRRIKDEPVGNAGAADALPEIADLIEIALDDGPDPTLRREGCRVYVPVKFSRENAHK